MRSQYRVSVEQNEYGQRLKEIWKLVDGRLNDGPAGQPAIQEWDETTGQLILKHRYFEGQSHCLTEAARQAFDPKSGEMISASWFKNGAGHREQVEGERRPSHWEKDPNTGVIVIERYEIEGKYHRLGGPADIERAWTNGNLTTVDFYERGTSTGYDIYDALTECAPDPDALKPLVP